MTIERTRHPRKRRLFALLSLADFAMTWLILKGVEGQAYEANPVAGCCLDRHGWAGLACFKAGAVALVLALTHAVSRSRPKAAGAVLSLGCASLAVVTAYSIALWGAAIWYGETEWHVERDLARLNAETRSQQRELAAFRALLFELKTATREGRCTLLEAAERLAPTVAACDRARIQILVGLDPDGPTVRRLACLVVSNALGSILDPEECARTLSRLKEEFQSTFGIPLPQRDRHFAMFGIPLPRKGRHFAGANQLATRSVVVPR